MGVIPFKSWRVNVGRIIKVHFGCTVKLLAWCGAAAYLVAPIDADYTS
jgi:hypothetical protein